MSKKLETYNMVSIINEKKKEVMVFILITLVVLTILIAFPIRLMALSVAKINSEIEGKRRIKEQLDEKIRDFTELNSQYEMLKDDMDDLPLVFPNQGDYSLFVANIDEICKANYFRLESASVDSARRLSRGEENPFSTLDFWTTSISVVGRRNDLVNLLEDLESMPMFPTVQVLGYKNELDEEGFLTFSISIRMYGVKNQHLYLDI